MKYISLSCVFLLLTSSIKGQGLTGKEIIQKVNEIFNPETAYMKAKMTIVTSSGEKRTFLYESWSKNKGEKSLMRYIEPRRVKDNAVLMLNNADDIWMYFPRTQRRRKLATHAKKQKMQGSDFSYEDMGGGEAFIKDFTAQRVKDEEMENYNCYKLKLTRNEDADVSYSKLIMWIIKDNFIPIVIDYYSEDDASLREKRLVQSNIKIIDNIPTAMNMIMYNKMDNTQTEMELLEVQYNLKLADNIFTERNLGK